MSDPLSIWSFDQSARDIRHHALLGSERVAIRVGLGRILSVLLLTAPMATATNVITDWDETAIYSGTLPAAIN
jgi:hypothetical protein